MKPMTDVKRVEVEFWKARAVRRASDPGFLYVVFLGHAPGRRWLRHTADGRLPESVARVLLKHARRRWAKRRPVMNSEINKLLEAASRR
jgi:hypothetical protein